MSIRHLPRLDPERWFVIDVDRSDGEYAPWQQRILSLHGPNCEASAEWLVLGKHGFGWGFRLGRNGGESDLGVDLYAGRVALLWLRLRAPWTKWARISKEQDPEHWYYARHTGIRIHPHDGCWFEWQFEDLDGRSSSDDPWWQRWTLTKYKILGRTRHESVDGDSGVARIPMPEGNYVGTWTERITTTHYVGRLGKIRDRIMRPQTRRYIDLSIEGGIPVEGKGENSWDCGMDGLFGCGGKTLEEAIGNAVKSVLRDRQRYGGPHDLDRPMTVSEAEKRHA